MTLFDYKESFTKLKHDLNGLKIHSLHFVDYDFLDLAPLDQLIKIGLTEENLVEYKVKGQQYGSDRGGSIDGNIRGCTTTVKIKGKIEQIVFVQEQPPKDNLDDDTFEYWKYVSNLCALSHELGHVEDIQRKKNSNFQIKSELTVNLVQAEIYAHTYCLNYLNKIGAKTTRNIVADGIANAASRGKTFQKNIYKGVCKEIGKGRIKKWIK